MRLSFHLTLSTLLSLSLFACAPDEGTDEPTDSDTADLKIGKKYLALGDSIPFGFDPVHASTTPTQISKFVGYPELVNLVGVRSVNAGCPGETTGSFLDASAPDNGCHGWKASGAALHVDYNGAPTQFAYALDFLAANKTKTATVSIQLGANDLFLLQNSCTASAPTPEAVGACIVASGGTKTPVECGTELVTACIGAGAPAVIGQTAQNIGIIIGGIRQTGYTGQVVVATYYALNYANPADPNLQLIYALDQALVQVAQATGSHVAKGFSTFGAASARAGGDSGLAGLRYKLPDGTYDFHPSRTGQILLAAAVAAAVPASSIDLSAPNPKF